MVPVLSFRRLMALAVCSNPVTGLACVRGGWGLIYCENIALRRLRASLSRFGTTENRMGNGRYRRITLEDRSGRGRGNRQRLRPVGITPGLIE